ncbi:L-ribulose-5-phosphate 3-epimerase [Breznakia pachnodae]|uniref:L-ribulose-5-phosphate 3-epimerase n=1 Tax=Breznakia pachnodae TaxID=265178 RepID=A0ABU0E1B9_9FIRM|nr:L-ribulose-5-phosphate 3-epimerase [Breznakia pachnodae]MDQ0360669.1 putative hexulose-6-phosphate isomerase [Breznakia pachnodae]
MDKRNSYQLGLYEKSMPNSLSIHEKLAVTKECGFDFFELSIDESDEKLSRLDMRKDERFAIVKAMYDTEVKIGSICLSGHRRFPLGHPETVMQNQSLNIMKKAIQLASDLGIPIIQLAGYDVYYEEGNDETKQLFEKNLKSCVLMAAAKGILLGFETMETSFMDTVSKSMEYVNLINNPYLGVYPDIGNLKNASLLYGTSVSEDLKLGTGKIIATHLKETIPNHYREIPFGTGHTEYIENLKVLKDMNVQRFVGEFWYINNEDWKTVIQDASKFLRNHLDMVFYDES